MESVHDVVDAEEEHYELFFRRQGEYHFIGNGYEWIHAKTVDQLERGDAVLDLGCGAGHHARLFARKGLEVSGLDATEAAVDICRDVFAQWGLKGRFTDGDARALPYGDTSFEASFCGLVLNLFPDYERVLAEAARVTRRFIFVFEPNIWNPQTFMLLNVANPIFSPSFLAPDQRAVNPVRVEKALRRHGFALKATHYATLGTFQKYSIWKDLAYRAQSLLPQPMRHTKFVQVYERQEADATPGEADV